VANLRKEFRILPLGEPETIFTTTAGKQALSVLIASCGTLANEAVTLAKELSLDGLRVSVINTRFIKPLPLSSFMPHPG